MSDVLLSSLVFSAVMFFFFGVRANRQQKRELVKHLATADLRFSVDEPEEEKKLGFLARLELEARQAGLDLQASQLLSLAIIGGVVAFAVVYMILPVFWVGAAASLVGIYVPRWWVARAKAKRSEDFSRALDKALYVMASALKAGASPAQAITRAAEQADEPVASELARAVRVLELGTTVEALSVVSQRVDSKDWELLVLATQILERTGGDLAEVYEQLGRTIRQRHQARQAIIAETSQARTSASVVGSIPVFVTLVLRVISPDYYASMLASTGGTIILVFAYLMIVLGFVWMRNMVNVPID